MGPPTLFAIGLILSAAVLHAVWNAIVKGSSDRTLSMALVILGHGVIALPMVLLYLPPASEAWPFLLLSTVIHFFYYGFLVLAYRYGDLSQVYPIARGIAPVLVALGAQFFAGETLPFEAWLGIAIISTAICLLVFANERTSINPRAIGAALVTGMTISAYTIADGMGVRASQSPIGYIGWLFVLECIAGFYMLWIRRSVWSATPAKLWGIGLAGGVISGVAYALVIYAQDFTNLGSVSAIRESSVIFAALIGVVWFGERPWRLRIVSAICVVVGVFLLTNGWH